MEPEAWWRGLSRSNCDLSENLKVAVKLERGGEKGRCPLGRYIFSWRISEWPNQQAIGGLRNNL